VKFYAGNGRDGLETAMKRSRRTTSRSTQRDAHAEVAAPAVNAPQHASARSEDQLRAKADPPLSLKSGAGRQYWDEVLRLLVKIRADCDAAAARLGYASRQDDGLAAVEYIANRILEAVAGERQQQIASAAKQSAPRPSEVQSPRQATYKSDQRAQPAQLAVHSERSKLTGELKQMLRDGKTKAGALIGPQLAHEIAKHITILNEERAQPETAQSMKRMRASLARFFGKVSGDEKKPSKATAAAQRPKQARTAPSGASKIVAKRSVTKPSVTQSSKGSKRRSR
jgi:hypothetical protein